MSGEVAYGAGCGKVVERALAGYVHNHAYGHCLHGYDIVVDVGSCIEITLVEDAEVVKEDCALVIVLVNEGNVDVLACVVSQREPEVLPASGEAFLVLVFTRS